MDNEAENIMSKIKIAVYGHGGSQNHGNEAIVRGVREIFPDADMKLYTFSVEADKHFGLDEICEVRPMTQNVRRSYISRGISKLEKIIRGKESEILKEKYYREYFRPFIDEIDPDTIYLLEAGDQYCELWDHRLFYAMLNREIKSRGAKSVMLGCTVDPNLMSDKNMIDDIRRYSLVIARESVTFNALSKYVKENLYLAPCPAFAMKKKTCDVPSWMCNLPVGGGGNRV